MKLQEIRELSPADLNTRIKETSEELANLKFQLSLHQLDNSAKVRQVRRTLARMLTIEKEIESGISERRATKHVTSRE